MIDVNLLNQIAAQDAGLTPEVAYPNQLVPQFEYVYPQQQMQPMQQMQQMPQPQYIDQNQQQHLYQQQMQPYSQQQVQQPSQHLMPGANNQLPTYEHKQQQAAQHDSKPAQGEWFEGKLISINLGIDGKQKEKCFGLIEIQGKTYSFNSYRNFIIIQTVWLKHLKVNAGGLDAKIQGTFKPKYNDPNTFILFAEDMEITNWTDLRTKAYAKEYPNGEAQKEHTVLKAAKLKLDKPKKESDVVENPF